MAGLFRTLKGLMKASSREPIIPKFKDVPGRGYRGPTPAKAVAKAPAVVDPTLQIVAPVDGRVLALQQVPDPTIAQAHLGAGMAVDAESGQVVAPVAGRVQFPFMTPHAFVITTDPGIDILVHIGIGTVDLAPGAFQARVADGDAVMAGQPVVDFAVDAVRTAVDSLATCVVVQNLDAHPVVLRPNGQGLHVFAGDDLFCLEVSELS